MYEFVEDSEDDTSWTPNDTPQEFLKYGEKGTRNTDDIPESDEEEDSNQTEM